MMMMAAISCLKRANYLAPFDWKILYNLGLVSDCNEGDGEDGDEDYGELRVRMMVMVVRTMMVMMKRANFLAPFDWKIIYNLGLVSDSNEDDGEVDDDDDGGGDDDSGGDGGEDVVDDDDAGAPDNATACLCFPLPLRFNQPEAVKR